MTKLVALLAIPVALLATVAALGVVVVDVRDGGPGGHHVVVPVPLLLVRTAAAFVPQQQARVELGEAARYVPLAREVLEALAEAPDGEMVRVEEPGNVVVVSKFGDTLSVRVRDGDDDVSVNVPLRVALRALPAHGRAVYLGDVAAALADARFTDLVEVRDGQDHVRVRVW
jgi:hypothetical protein